MLRTILVLIASLIALPILAFYYDMAPGPEQWAALKTATYLMLGVSAWCFLVGEITGNVSQTDKLWSIMPIFYVWIFAAASSFDPRMVLIAGLVTLWGLRLTYNFARRGGYHWIPWKGEEDYRWEVLRKMPLLSNRFSWSAFNLFFICLYQQSLILLITLPALVAWQGNGTPLYWTDYILAAILIGLLVLETKADQEQYDFQTEKYRRKNAGKKLDGEYALGFCWSGLWAKVRHPNYAAEQAIWLCVYGLSVAASGRWLNWSLAGVILLMLLFLGSSDFSEKISAGKYPAYADYQRAVPRFFPRFFGGEKRREDLGVQVGE